MTTKLRTKVRLVKCPKCSKILPEPEQVPLYTCGGCGTILQAKYYKADNRASGLGSQDRIGSESNGILRSHDGGESSSSSQRSSFTVGHLSDQNETKDHDAAEDHNSTQLGGSNSDRLTSSSEKSIFLENKGDGETDIKPNTSNLEDQAVNQNDQDPGAAKSPDEASFTADTTILENKGQYADATAENRANSSDEASETDDSQLLERNEQSRLGQDHAVDADKRQQISEVIDSDDREQAGNVGSLQEETSALNDSLVTGAKEALNNGSENYILVENKEECREGKHSHEKNSAEDSYCDPDNSPNLGKEESSENAPDDSMDYIQEQLGNIHLTEPSTGTEITRGRNENSTAGRADSRVSKGTRNADSSGISGDRQCESNSLKNVTEISKHETEDSDDVSACESEIMRSIDNGKLSEPVHAHRENDRLHETVQRSPTKGSFAYDGSVSSFDGNDDQGIVQQDHTSPSPVASPELKNPGSREAYSNSGFQNKAKTSSQMLSDEKLKSSMSEEVESIEESAIPVRNRTRPKRDGFVPRVPPYHSSELVYETGSSSGYIHEEFPTHRTHHYPYKYDNSHSWVKREYAQREYINRRRFQETFWRENEFAPTYYNYETSGEIYQRSRHIPGYVDRRRRAESWSLSGSLPRGHYSGEIFNGRHRPVRDSYMNRIPDDVRWSGQLPPPPPTARWDSLYDSCPASPRKYPEPDPYPWAHDAASVSGDQRLRDQIMRRLQIREKRQAVKSHCRPMAGGAPFVTCCFCRRVVQLPEHGFLVARRRGIVHRVRCGACSSILEFSLENETGLGLIPRVPPEGEDPETDTARSEEKAEKYQRAGGRSQSRQTKVTWQTPSRRSKSPLHRLMGYSSPHDMLNAHEGDDLDW